MAYVTNVDVFDAKNILVKIKREDMMRKLEGVKNNPDLVRSTTLNIIDAYDIDINKENIKNKIDNYTLNNLEAYTEDYCKITAYVEDNWAYIYNNETTEIYVNALLDRLSFTKDQLDLVKEDLNIWIEGDKAYIKNDFIIFVNIIDKDLRGF